MRLAVYLSILALVLGSYALDKRFWFNGGNAEEGSVLGLGVGIGTGDPPSSDSASGSSTPTVSITIDSTPINTISSLSSSPKPTIIKGPGPAVVRQHHSKKQFIEPDEPDFNPFFSYPFGSAQIGTTQDTHLDKVKHGKKGRISNHRRRL